MKFLPLAALLLGASPVLAEDADRATVVVAPIKTLSSIEGINILTEELRTQVARHGRYKLVTPEEMQAVDGELARQLEGGCDDASCVAEIGGALGAQFVITGQIGKLGTTYNLSLKLVNIETVAAEQAASRRSKSIEIFLEQMPNLVVDLLGPSERRSFAAAESKAPPKSSSKRRRALGLLGGIVNRINAETDRIQGGSSEPGNTSEEAKKDDIKAAPVKPIEASSLPKRMTKTLSLFASSTNLASLRFDWRSTRSLQWEFDLGVFSGLGLRWAPLGYLDTGASLNLLLKAGGNSAGGGFITAISGAYRKVMPSRVTITGMVGIGRLVSPAYIGIWSELGVGIGKSY
jgi:TolB-like protein